SRLDLYEAAVGERQVRHRAKRLREVRIEVHRVLTPDPERPTTLRCLGLDGALKHAPGREGQPGGTDLEHVPTGKIVMRGHDLHDVLPRLPGHEMDASARRVIRARTS